MEELFHAALELPKDRRERFLRDSCGDDNALYASVTELLDAEQASGDGQLTGIVQQEARNLSEPALLSHGDKLGQYVIDAHIGAGGMGDIYAAEQLEPVQRKVAIKVMRFGANDPRVLSRFEGERQALAMMSHPSIATVHDAGATPAGQPFFVMELVQGKPLDAFMREEKLALEALLELFVQVCRALEHAHQKGVIHRDLKPGNILIENADGTIIPKIIDFGIAKATLEPFTATAVETYAHQMIGTPLYMSPEQADTGGADIDTRSDIYALGTILYELLTGAHPLDTDKLTSGSFSDRQQAFAGVIARPSMRLTTQQLSGRQRRLVADLDWVVLRALENDRERRYSSAGDFADDIQRALAQLPVLAGPPGEWYRLSKFVQRNRVPVLAGVAVFVALVAGLSAATMGFVRATASEQVAQEKAATADAVTGFLIQLFQASDPTVDNLADMTTRDLLARGMNELDQELIGQETTKAAIHFAIGRVYGNLALHDESYDQYSKAVALYESMPEAERPAFELADALTGLAGATRRKNDAENALALSERALALYEAIQPEDQLPVADAMRARAQAQRALGRYEEGRDQMAAAVDIISQAAPGTIDHAASLYDLAGMLFYTGEDEAALANIRTAIELFEEIDPTLPQVADAYSGLGAILSVSGDQESALRAMESALERRIVARGDNHHTVAEAHQNVAGVLFEQGEYERAYGHLSTAAPIARDAPGTNEQNFANMLEMLALTAAHLGRMDEAELAIEEAEIFRAKLPDDHPTRMHALDARAVVAMIAGDIDTARRLSREVLDQRASVLPADHRELVKLVNRLQQLDEAAAP